MSRTVPAGRVAASEHASGHSHLGLALVLISAAQLMVVLDGTIVNIALPHIQTDLDFTPANLSWVVNAYTLAFGGLLLLGGRAGDLLGRRKVFMTGIAIFVLASFLGGISQSETMLLAARVLQGLGAAIASPTALSLVTTTFPAGPARNRAFGVYAAMSGAGAAIGLLLGGVLTESSWRWTFFVNVPIGLLVLAFSRRVLAESTPETGGFDLPGALSATAGLVLLVYGLTHAATDGWSDAVTLVTIGLGVVLIAAFLVIEYRSRQALMPFRVLANRTRAISLLAILIVGAGMFALFYFLGLYLQQVLGYSPVKSGLAFLPFSAGIVIAAQIASFLITRLDPRWISAPGFLLAAGGMYGLTRLQVDSSYVSGLLPFMLMIAVGIGLIFVPLTLTSVTGVAREDAGIGAAVFNTMQQVGGAIGLAVLSTVSASATTSRAAELAGSEVQPRQLALLAQTHGATQAFLVAALMVLAAGVIVAVGLNAKRGDLASKEAGDMPVHVG